MLVGGDPVGNALVVISKLGVKAEVIGGFGDDNAADYLIEDFEHLGVATQNAKKIRGASSLLPISYFRKKANRARAFSIVFPTPWQN